MSSDSFYRNVLNNVASDAKAEGQRLALVDHFRWARRLQLRENPEKYLCEDDAKEAHRLTLLEQQLKCRCVFFTLTFDPSYSWRVISDAIHKKYQKLKWISRIVYYFEQKECGLPHVHCCFEMLCEYSIDKAMSPFKKILIPFLYRDELTSLDWKYFASWKNAINYCDMSPEAKAWRESQGMKNMYLSSRI